MSVFTLKILAVLTMITDHAAYIMSLNGYAGGRTILIMRAVGRVAFPVFAFLIVNGLRKTRDRSAYFSRLALFALLSQIPFVLAFSACNYQAPALRGAESFLAVDPLWLRHLPFILAAALVYYLLLHKRGRQGFFCVLGALLLPLFRLKLGGFLLLDAKLNVFFSLAMCLAMISAIDAVMTRDERYTPVELALLVTAAAGAALYILPNADYGYNSILLIALLYLFKSSRTAQAVAAAAWCAYMYSFSVYFLIGGLCACGLILMYNGKKGPSFKLGFYLIYPVHLIFLFVLVFLYNISH